MPLYRQWQARHPLAGDTARERLESAALDYANLGGHFALRALGDAAKEYAREQQRGGHPGR